jgi:cytochrome bd-type quinol oxidase subunit 2
MDFDAAISFLSHSNWGFLAVWLVLLAVAFTASFPERTSTSASPSHGNSRRHP